MEESSSSVSYNPKDTESNEVISLKEQSFANRITRLEGKKVAVFIENMTENGSEFVCNVCHLGFPDITTLESHIRTIQHKTLIAKPIKYQRWIKNAVINESSHGSGSSFDLMDSLDAMMEKSCKISNNLPFSPITMKSSNVKKIDAPKKPSPSHRIQNRVTKKRKLFERQPRMLKQQVSSLLMNFIQKKDKKVAATILGDLLQHPTHFSKDQFCYLRELYCHAVDIEMNLGKGTSNNLLNDDKIRDLINNIRSSLQNKLHDNTLSLKAKDEVDNLMSILGAFELNENKENEMMMTE